MPALIFPGTAQGVRVNDACIRLAPDVESQHVKDGILALLADEDALAILIDLLEEKIQEERDADDSRSA